MARKSSASGSGSQRSGINVAGLLEHGVRRILAGEWTQPKPVAHSPILDALNLIHLNGRTSQKVRLGQTDGRG